MCLLARRIEDRGGVEGGEASGCTDELGSRAVERKVHVHDLHATMLALLSFNHERPTTDGCVWSCGEGRRFLSVVAGSLNVINSSFASQSRTKRTSQAGDLVAQLEQPCAQSDAS